MVLIVDIDGTIADVRHRAYLINVYPTLEEGYKAFFLACDRDCPIKRIVEIIDQLGNSENTKVVFLTARPEYVREKTVAWLKEHTKVKKYSLIMKAERFKYTKTVEFKKKALEGIKYKYPHDEYIVFEDDEENIKMFVSEKVIVYKVKE